jgi:hypothetical protein
VPGQQFATILARTDPFDLAEAVERYVRSLEAAEVRAVILAASPRLSEWYRAEFVSLLGEPDGERLKASFAHSLRSNLRAISFFGPSFCEGVIRHVPSDRTVGIGEEEDRQFPRVRPLAVAIVAAAVFIAGAAAQRVISTAQSNARTPVVLFTPVPAAPVTPPPHIAAAPTQTQQHVRPLAHPPSPAHSAPRVALAPQVQHNAPPGPRVQPAPFPQPPPPEHRAASVVRRAGPRTPPPGSGVKTIIAQQPRVQPTPEPTPIDVTDMPRSYSDATPLPADQTPPPVEVAVPQRVAAPPTEAPRGGSWLHRTVMHLDPLKPQKGGFIYKSVMHLDPFKPHPQPTATATGGPQQ